MGTKASAVSSSTLRNVSKVIIRRARIDNFESPAPVDAVFPWYQLRILSFVYNCETT